jgi:hypothetical protein
VTTEQKGAEMHILRIEHPVPDFDAWKDAFDSDPVGREQGGVRSFRIMRSTDDRLYVMIDLEFDDASSAEAFLAKLRELWTRVQGRIMESPQARIVEVVENSEP